MRHSNRLGAIVSLNLWAWFVFIAIVVTTPLYAQNVVSWQPEALLNSNAHLPNAVNERPRIATDGEGVYIVAWHSHDSLGGTLGAGRNLLYSRSVDFGDTWSDAALLNKNGLTGSGHDWRHQLAYGANGVLLAVWQSSDSFGGASGGTNILAARSIDNGLSWEEPFLLSQHLGTHMGAEEVPQLVSDGAGNWMVVWRSGNSLNGSIGNDLDILFVRSSDDGVTWSDVAPLNNDAATDSRVDRSPRVGTDGAGRWLCIWMAQVLGPSATGNDWDVYFAYSDDFGASWTAPAPLNTNAATDSGDDRAPQLATDKQGNWVVVWRSNETLNNTIGTDLDIFSASSLNNGATWTAPQPVNTNAAFNSGADQGPQLATDNKGVWTVLWMSRDTFGNTLGTDWDLIAAHSLDNGLAWTDPTPVKSTAATDTANDRFMDIASDQHGGWLAVWQSTAASGGVTNVLFSRGTTSHDRPTVTLTTPVEMPTSSMVIPVEVHFSEPVSGFQITDLFQINGLTPFMINDFVGSGSHYSFMIGPISQGSMAISIPANVAFNAEGAGNLASAPLNIDFMPESVPSVGIFTNTVSPTSQKRYRVRGSFSSQVPFIDESHFVVENGTLDSLGLNYYGEFSMYISPMGPGEVRIQVPENVVPGGNLASNVLRIDYQPSTAEVLEWGPKYQIGRGESLKTGHNISPRVAQDGAGVWVTVWETESPLCEALGPEKTIAFSRSTDHGRIWSTPAALHLGHSLAGDGADRRPEVESGDDGVWIAVWESSRNLEGVTGSEWDILFSRSTDSGETWAVPKPLNTYAGTGTVDNVSPHIVYGGHGVWLATWTSYEDPAAGPWGKSDIYLTRSEDDGVTWSVPTLLSPDPGTEQVFRNLEPRLETDGAGNWLAIWYSGITPFSSPSNFIPGIVVARSHDNGATWSAPSFVYHQDHYLSWAGYSYGARLASTGEGEWLATWTTRYSTAGSLEVSLVSRSLNEGRTWSPPVPLLNEFAWGQSRAGEARVLSMPDGTWAAIWLQEHEEYISVWNLLHAYSNDGGQTWTDSAVLVPYVFPYVPNTKSPDLDMAVDDSGQILAVWSGRRFEALSLDGQRIFYATTPHLAPPPPSVTLSSSAPNPLTASSFELSAVFSESVAGFTADDIVVSNGTVTNFSGCGAQYHFEVTPSWPGFVSVSIPAGAAESGSWQTNTAPATLLRNYVPPILPAATAVQPSYFGPVNFRDVGYLIVFNRDVIGFSEGTQVIIEHTGTSHENVVIAGGPRIYGAVVEGLHGDGFLTMSVDTNSGITDLDGVPLATSVTSPAMYIDTIPPAVDLTASGTHFNGPVHLEVAVSEPVEWTPGLGSLLMENASLVSASGAQDGYAMTIQPLAEGPFRVQVRANAFKDVAGNSNLPSILFEGVYDTTPPEFRNVATSPVLVHPGERFRLTFQVNEALSAAPVITFNGAPMVAYQEKSGNAYTYQALSDPLGPLGGVNVQIVGSDLAGNVGVFENPALFTLVDSSSPLPLRRLALLGVMAGLLALGAFQLRRVGQRSR